MGGLLTSTVDRTNLVLCDFFGWIGTGGTSFFTGVSMEKGRPYTCIRCRQEELSPKADPNMVELIILHPIIVEIYYSACGQIDKYNRCLQESLHIEKKWILKVG